MSGELTRRPIDRPQRKATSNTEAIAGWSPTSVARPQTVAALDQLHHDVTGRAEARGVRRFGVLRRNELGDVGKHRPPQACSPRV